MTESVKPPKQQENPWLNLLFNIAIPTLILMKLSPENRLGPTWALILGCALPIGYGVYDYLKKRKINFFSVLGLVAVLTKGIFGLLSLPALAFACNEASLPIIFCIAILWTTRWDPPLVQRFLLSPQMFNLDKMQALLEEKGTTEQIRPLMVKTSIGYAGTLVLSAILNFFLALRILKAEPGTAEFVDQIGRFTGLQFPVIALPLMLVTFVLLYYVMHNLGKLTGVPATHLLAGMEEHEEDSSGKKESESQEA